MTTPLAQRVPFSLPGMNEEREFIPVGGSHLEKFPVLEEIFHRILEPLYGSQSKALEQIKLSQDRKCFLLYEKAAPVGVLVFKTQPSDEFKELGVVRSIEIKSLFVDNAAQNSGKGLGSALLDKLYEEVNKLALGHLGIHVTVSETKQESMAFFRKKHFEIIQKWDGRYLPGVVEYLLSCPTEQAKRACSPSTLQKAALNLLRTVTNIHWDDIHALTLLANGTFISGSKDGSLIQWNAQGDVVRIVDEPEPMQHSERNWITAVGRVNAAYWVSAERNGRAFLWDNDGRYVKEIGLRLPPQGHVSHAYNRHRINCVAPGANPDKPSVFVGLPTMFDEYNLIENRTTSYAKVHKNDWVFALHPLTSDKVLAVVGDCVDVWERESTSWKKNRNPLVAKEDNYTDPQGKSQRSFISALKPLETGPGQFGLSLFNGTVKVLDINSESIVHTWNEHKGRVWTITPIDAYTFASGSEDRSVKLWDTRQLSSIATLPNHVGQVTALLGLKQDTLVVAACQNNALTSKKGAELRFYDLRR
jgi:WD40 repeat protein